MVPDTFVEYSFEERLARCAEWPTRFSPEEWSLYRGVIAGITERNIPFALGGALAAMTYSAGWRNTKDMDVYALSRDRDLLVELFSELGLEDYYAVQPYDRRWIYRAHRGDMIVDFIWAMANQRAQVDQTWFDGPHIQVDGVGFRLLAPEEIIWSKLYILQRDRCDWTDCWNVLYGVGHQLDWLKLIEKVGEDRPLLASLLSAFIWLAPQRAREFPAFLWRELGIKPPQDHVGNDVMRQRAELLDSRPWLTPLLNAETSEGTKIAC